MKKFSVMHDSPEVKKGRRKATNLKVRVGTSESIPNPLIPAIRVSGAVLGGVISVFYVFEVQVALLNYLPVSILDNISP